MSYGPEGGAFTGSPYVAGRTLAAASDGSPPVTPIVAVVQAEEMPGNRRLVELGPATGNGWYLRRITVQGDFS